MNKKETPIITIVTVVYNGVGMLEKTIVSVLEQSYPEIEFIVVDGGSTDGTIEIVDHYKKNISKWVSEPDSGIYNAMNKGAKMAVGDWICFLNCGDVFVNKDCIKNVVFGIMNNENASVIYGNILIKTKERELKEKIAKAPCNSHKMYFCHQSAFVRRELLIKYPFDETHRMSADMKFFKERFLENKQFVHLNFPVVIYDTFGISNTNRIAGLRDNISVIREVDRGLKKILFLSRLHFTIYWRILSQKK